MSLQHVKDLTSQDKWKVKAGQEACGIVEECRPQDTDQASGNKAKRRKSSGQSDGESTKKKKKGNVERWVTVWNMSSWKTIVHTTKVEIKKPPTGDEYKSWQKSGYLQQVFSKSFL